MEETDLYIDGYVIALAFLTSTMIVMIKENPMATSRFIRKVFKMTTQLIGIAVISFTYGRLLTKLID